MPRKNNSGLERNGNRWRFRVRVDGKQVWIYVPVEYQGILEAKQWKNRHLGQDVSARVVPSKTKVIDYAEKFIAESKLDEDTRKLYRSQFRLHLSHLCSKKLSELEGGDIRGVVFMMREKGLSENTIRIALVPLRAMCRAAVARGDLSVSPFDRVERRDLPKPPKRSRRLMLEDPKQVLELIFVAGPRFGALIALGFFAGLRLSEALGLTWDKVDFKNNVIHVTHQLGRNGVLKANLKGGDEENPKERDVEMSEGLAKILRELRGDRITRVGEFVIGTDSGKAVSQRNAQRAFDKARERMGIDITFHGLRHNFASLLIASGADVGFVADQLGHDDPNITLGLYRHEFKKAREKGTAAAAIDAYLAKAQR